MHRYASGKQDVFIEVAEKFRQYIESGVYKSGDALPSVRAAALDLGVNPNTVQKAYALLEKDGCIVVKPKKGAFVAARGGAEPDGGGLEAIRRLREGGVSRETLLKWIEEVYDHD